MRVRALAPLFLWLWAPSDDLGFPERLKVGSFELHADKSCDLAEWGDFAVAARARIQGWLASHVARAGEPRTIQVYLCSDAARIERTSEALSPAGPRPDRAASLIRKRGHFLQEKNAILVRFGTPYQLKRDLAHEISHLVLREQIDDPPTAVDEGIAEVMSSWLLDTNDGGPEAASAAAPRYVETLRKLREEGKLLAALELVAMDYWTFHRGVEEEEAHYAQSWALMKAVLESSQPNIREWIFESIQRRRRHPTAPTRHAFLSEARPIASALQKEMESVLDGFAKGFAVWGVWHRAEPGWTVSTSKAGTSMLVLPETIPTDRACVVRVRLEKPLPKDHVVRIVYDAVDFENYQCVEVDRTLATAHYRRKDDAWEPAGEKRRESARARIPSELALALLPDGTLELTSGSGAVLLSARQSPWRRAAGKVGLAFYRATPPAEGEGAAEIRVLEFGVDTVP